MKLTCVIQSCWFRTLPRFFSFSEWNQSMHFHYNISYLSEREKILAAEFHVFKMRPAPPKFKESKPPYVIEVIYNPFSLHL